MTFDAIRSASRFRALLVLIPGIAFSIWTATQIGAGEFKITFAILALFSALIFFAVVVRDLRFEEVVCGLLLIGYLVGNRGFADLAVVRPFFVGELAMIAVFGAALLRFALTRQGFDLSGWLAKFILTYLILALLRFRFGGMSYGTDGLRDLAMVYYAVFFFVGRSLCRTERSERFIESCLAVSFAGLAVVSVIHRVAPDLMVSSLAIGGTPLFFQKDDLTTTFAAAAAIFLFTRPGAYQRQHWFRMILILLFLVFVLNGITRASIVGLSAASLLLWIAGRRRFFLYVFVGVALGMTLLAGFSTTFEHTQASKGSAMIEKLASIVDYSSQNHGSEIADLKAGNNEFRREIWKWFVREAWRDNPLFGKGFGYNFLPGFETYFGGEWIGLRSPHNYYVTVFGRMGVVGLLIFLAITWQIVAGGIKAARSVRKGRLNQKVLGYWCGAWAILVAATFGVVLEGPIGAIVFWTFLGLAVAGTDRAVKERGSAARLASEGGEIPKVGVIFGDPRKQNGPIPYKGRPEAIR